MFTLDWITVMFTQFICCVLYTQHCKSRFQRCVCKWKAKFRTEHHYGFWGHSVHWTRTWWVFTFSGHTSSFAKRIARLRTRTICLSTNKARLRKPKKCTFKRSAVHGKAWTTLEWTIHSCANLRIAEDLYLFIVAMLNMKTKLALIHTQGKHVDVTSGIRHHLSSRSWKHKHPPH